MKYEIKFVLNDEEVTVCVQPHMTLLEMLRENFDLTGAKEGCGAGECGACTVLMDGKAVNACLVLAVEVHGKEVRTVEGLSIYGELDELQHSFIEHGALQCGYCTPGMIMSAKALLLTNPIPSEEEVVKTISGNLCRCTGYKKIVEAIMAISNREAAKVKI